MMVCAVAIPTLLTSCDTRSASHTSEKPNILIILTDQQTNDCLSLLGNPNLHTPYLDSLARRGVYFTESYCTSPVCGPSRSSLLTGRMPHETGVIWNSTNIDDSVPTIGRLFANAGYNTAYAGKWHLPEGYPAQKSRDSIAGFKVIPFQSLDSSWDKGAETDGPIADAAVKYLNDYEEDKPFLLTVSLHNPHDICYVPREPDAYAKYSEIDAPLPPLPANFNPAMKEPEFLEQKRLMDHYGDELLKTKDYTEADWQAYLYHYYRFAEMVDAEIGKIWNALRAKGLDENTIIAFSSDHGDGAASHRWAAKLSLYEEVVKVPFGISWPGRIAVGRVDRKQLISGADLVPTLCEYAGVTAATGFTGKSLKKVLDHPEETHRAALVVQLEDDKLDTTRHARLVRDGRFKYNLYNKGARNEQLFDLLTDPGETKNLAYETTYQPVKARLKKNLNEWMIENKDNIPLP
ncbi:sulfatase [Persicitalea jodogahamensis]|uniref:Sulfatase n=2 Tax=Persicitalea jodogahamensis TaxID=402147 RepID=A0A8J3DBY9_9BACT|nr:sulfatase [Persicitalea jodogahamensis]